MIILILKLIGLLCMHWIIMLLILTVLELNTFQKKSEILLAKKRTSKYIQVYNSVMCGYFCIGFIDFMLKDKSLTDFTNLFSSADFRKNDDITLNYFKNGLI